MEPTALPQELVKMINGVLAQQMQTQHSGITIPIIKKVPQTEENAPKVQ
jgi:hypothetical protein